MAWSDIPWHPPIAKLRWFAAFGAALFTGLAALQFLHAGNVSAGLALAGAALALALVGLVAPQRLRLVFVGMMVLSYPLNWLVSHVILALLYYCVFTPIALFFKLIGRDPLQRRFDRERASYWAAKPQATDIRSYFRQS
ncbi:MAG: SxtJ family membrane protein [Gemmataceae bacterium]